MRYSDRPDEEDTPCTPQKTENEPFADIIIRDDEFLDRLQGEWKLWPDGKETLVIEGSRLSWSFLGGGEFHAVSYTYNRELVELVPADLIRQDFGSFGKVRVREDRLETSRIIYDMNVPLSVFAREDMLKTIAVPDAVLSKGAGSTMSFVPAWGINLPWMGNDGNMARRPDGEKPEKKEGAHVCPECGYDLGDGSKFKFCPECGTPLK